MATIIKLLAITLFLGIIGIANGECSVNNIEIGQTRTGNWAHGAPVWDVTVSNTCGVCSMLQVTLNCTGFQTNIYEDPSILSVSGSECLVKNGQPIDPSQKVTFQYAWDHRFPFHLLSATIACH